MAGPPVAKARACAHTAFGCRPRVCLQHDKMYQTHGVRDATENKTSFVCHAYAEIPIMLSVGNQILLQYRLRIPRVYIVLPHAYFVQLTMYEVA
jgi:hypothetical protein